jgi:hypothetical protein
VLDHYAHRLQARSEIGSPASLATLAALSRGAQPCGWLDAGRLFQRVGDDVPMKDLRPTIEQAARADRRRQIRVGIPGTVILLSLGLAMVLGMSSGTPAWLAVFAASCIALGLTAALALTIRALSAGPLPPCTVVLGTVNATAVLRSGREFRVGMAMVAVMAGSCGAWSALAFDGGATAWGFFLAVPAAHLLSGVVLAAAGRYTAGGVWLTPDGVLYRSKGLQSWVRWDDVGAALADEPNRSVRVVVHQGTTVEHRYRAGWWHGDKSAGPLSAVLHVEGLALIATDLARTVGLYASEPAARSELGTQAALARMAARRLEAVTELVSGGPIGTPLMTGSAADSYPSRNATPIPPRG